MQRTLAKIISAALQMAVVLAKLAVPITGCFINRNHLGNNDILCDRASPGFTNVNLT